MMPAAELAGSVDAPSGSLSAFTEDFLAFETAHNLFSLEIDGHQFWDYIRYAVFYEHVNATLDYTVPPSAEGGRSAAGIAGRAGRLVRGMLRPSDREPCDILVLNYVRDRLFDGRLVNIQTYPFIKAVASKYSVRLLDPAWTESAGDGRYPCPVESIWTGEEMDRIGARTMPLSSTASSVCAELSAALVSGLGVRAPIDQFVKRRYGFQRRSYDRYRHLLSQLRPRLVVYVDSASQKGLITAARSLGITTVDLQHSLISPVNILYRYSPGQPPLPTMSDVIFTFGEFWHRDYRLPVKCMAVGFPYQEAERARFWPSRQPDAIRAKSILVISDVTYSRDRMAHTALELARLLPTYRVFYKLRPDDYSGWTERYPVAFREQPNFTVIDSDDVPLYEYFSRCAWQVGINSTALYEGLSFGLRTLILKTGWYEEMKSAYEGGYAYLAMNAVEIAAAVTGDWKPPAAVHIDRIFRPGSTQNIADAVDQLMAQSA
jgi:hypothetical protein